MMFLDNNSARKARFVPLVMLTGLVASSGMAGAQTVAAPYSSDYIIGYNGSVADVPARYGGLIFAKNDPATLYLMGRANEVSGTIYSVPVIRGVGGHISSFGATATVVSTAADNDGGLVYAPNGDLLFTRYVDNEIGQIKPGSVSPDKIVSLPGVTSSVGTLQYVPAGFSNAGQLKIVSYGGGGWYDATLTADGSGTYDIATTDTGVNTGNGPEGVVYVHSGNPDFGVNSILLVWS